MDNLFPREPVHDARTPVVQTLSSDRTATVNSVDTTKYPETTENPALTQTPEDAGHKITGQLISPADRNQAEGSYSMGSAPIQSGALSPVLPLPAPPTASQAEQDISLSRSTVKPDNSTRDMAIVEERHPTALMPHSAERLEQQKPTLEGRSAEPLAPSLADLQSKNVGSSTFYPAKTIANETGKSADAHNQPVDASQGGSEALVQPNPNRIPNEYPEDTKEELGRISADITAARPRSEQARQVFANRSRIRGLLALDHTVKEIYNHLVKVERVSAEKVSFKQFERQVDTLNLRSKLAKTSPPIRSTDRS